MAKLLCECGVCLSNSMVPNLMEGHLRGIYEYKDRDVWECKNCGRLAIDVLDEKGLTKVKWYKPEDEQVGNLFDIGSGEELIQHLKDLWILNKKEFLMIETGQFD